MTDKPAPVALAFTRPLARPTSGLDLDDSIIEETVAARGAPELMHPSQDGPEPSGDPADAPKGRKKREPVPGAATPRSKWQRVTVELPDYLVNELKDRAHEQRISIRHAVMKAMRAAHYKIIDADMIEDARKGNGRAKPKG